MKSLFSSIALFLFFSVLSVPLSASGEKALLLRLEGTVNPVIAEHIARHLQEPEAPYTVIKMDTPGGLMDSMRQIVKAIEASPRPVVVYVGDSGARAASAGTFILISSDLAVMARGTNVGAAHPVRMGGGGEEEGVDSKAVEDARAFIKSLALKHSRNAEWAQEAVTLSASITAREALEMNVIEYIVDDFSGLKEILEGKEVKKGGNIFTLSARSGFREEKLSPIRQFLNYISHPNLAYILLILGVYGFIYEAANPGIGFGAVLGAISLLLASLAFQIIPVNWVGILLIILGAMLMLLDVWVPSEGILTFGGVIAFAAGSLMLFDVTGFPLRVSPSLVFGAAAGMGAFFLFAAGAGINIQKKKPSTGKEGMKGLAGEAMQDLDPRGTVYVRGEIWSAVSKSGAVKKGEKIKVKKVEGNVLEVEREKEEEY